MCYCIVLYVMCINKISTRKAVRLIQANKPESLIRKHIPIRLTNSVMCTCINECVKSWTQMEWNQVFLRVSISYPTCFTHHDPPTKITGNQSYVTVVGEQTIQLTWHRKSQICEQKLRSVWRPLNVREVSVQNFHSPITLYVRHVRLEVLWRRLLP